jgi:hypothetical protein
MNDEAKAANNADDPQGSNTDGKQPRIEPSQTGTSNHQATPANTNGPNHRPKPSILVRGWHALWRKRIFIHQGGPNSPNWAEKSGMVITSGILLAACIQLYIYWEQAGIMRNSLQQNERSIMLGRGQLETANRSAGTAAGNLAESKKQFQDTLKQMQAQSAAQQRAATASQNAAKATQQQVVDSENGQRARLIATQTIDNEGKKIVFTITNIGHSAALDILVNVSSDQEPFPKTMREGDGYPPDDAVESHIHPIPSDKSGFTLAEGEHRDFVGDLPQPKDIPSGQYSFMFINVGYKDIFGCTENAYSCAYSRPARGHRFQRCWKPIRYPDQPCHGN